MAWVPILEGAPAEEAWRVVRDVANDLVALPCDRLRPDDAALFWAYAAPFVEGGPERYEAAVEALVDRVARPFTTLALFDGLAGSAWVIAHICEPCPDELEILDQGIAAQLAAPWPGHFDLIRGLAGLGIYLLERDTPTTRAALARLVDQLGRTGERTPEGLTWFTPPEELPAGQREQAPRGHHDCGLAHGVAGPIAVLARAARRGSEPARELCAAAVRWLRGHELADEPRSVYPSVIPLGDRPVTTRTAWCYGDIGVAIALWHATASLGRDAGGAELARVCAARSPALCDVADAALCHGSVGLAHFFNRCFQASGDPLFRDAALTWFARTLAAREPGRGIGGFTTGTRAEPGFLGGAAGIALALLAALRPEEPGWDRLLACDLPGLP